MNVSAIIVTRGDVDCDEIVCSFPPEWETLLWDNGAKMLTRWKTPGEIEEFPVTDLAVYGRYAAIEYASHDVVFVQDDDCVVSDPQAIVDRWLSLADTRIAQPNDVVVCNMPPEFRHDFYRDHALVGFGACFHRDAPQRAFQRMYRDGLAQRGVDPTEHSPMVQKAYEVAMNDPAMWPEFFHRTCDIVFTALTPRVFVDVPYKRLPWDSDPNRMWMQPEHQAERTAMLELVKQVRG